MRPYRSFIDRIVSIININKDGNIDTFGMCAVILANLIGFTVMSYVAVFLLHIIFNLILGNIIGFFIPFWILTLLGFIGYSIYDYYHYTNKNNKV